MKLTRTKSGILIGCAFEPKPAVVTPTKPSAWHRVRRWFKWRNVMARMNRAFPGSADGPAPF